MDIANASFGQRRWLIEELDVKATLTTEDGQQIAYVECRLGEKPKRLEITDYPLLSHTSWSIGQKNTSRIILTARLVIEED